MSTDLLLQLREIKHDPSLFVTRPAAQLVLQCERSGTDVTSSATDLIATLLKRPTHMQLEELFQQPQALPAVPKIVQELIDSFNDEDVSIESIARKLAADPVLSARLLRLANSAYYHVSRTIGTVPESIAMLGFVTVRTLVISSGLTGGYKSMPGLDLSQFWRYSMHTAAISGWLAQQARVNRDQAFTVGLMHAIGELVMHAGMPAAMQQLDQQSSPFDDGRLALEESTFGYHFATVGSELARQWRFPLSFVNAICHFPAPLTQAKFDPVAGVLHLAAWRARAELHKLDAQAMAAQVPAEVCASLGFSTDVLLHEMPPIAELCDGLEALIS